MLTKISIIVPCYNSEATLDLTLKSIFNQNFQDWEAIIVNDGSIDFTEEIAKKWTEKDKRFKYFSKENGGLGKARNFGIQRAQGIYILPLDSDNLVEENFVTKAIDIFEEKPDVGVVHGYAEYFGEKTGIWEINNFNLQSMLIQNYIDACAIFRKDLWQKTGGYDENMPYQGHEDWEFWLSLHSIGCVFFNLRTITFKYFVSSKSMIRSFTDEMNFLNQDYIVKKHSKLFYNEYIKISIEKGKQAERLKSKKFVIDSFCNLFFGFRIFSKTKNKDC